MKKILISILLVALTMTSLFLSGCSDFNFNPTGRWNFSEDLLYINDELAEKTTAENDIRMNNVSIVFEKSGTGYIDSHTKSKIKFTYEYNNNEVTVIMPDKSDNPNKPDNRRIKYMVSDDWKTLSRIDTQTITDENGKKITYREEFVYKK